MNTQLKQPSFFRMIEEHQQLSERVLRLDELLSNKKYNEVLPAAAHNLMKQMKDIVMTGSTLPAVNSHLLYANDLPFIDAERPQNVEHEFEVGDIVNVPSRMAQHKFIVSSKQRFIVERLIGAEQLKLKCVCGQDDAWKGFNLEITGHHSHFANLG
ncbi:hypothetical protein [Acinetobacter bereziniae]|uniref:hypothetical protein n=1 Tax=Acinetobacter bereziniae TaxID=106648 RepID=UPI002575D4A3|nr:hypothetical protein [Acinetobacter bereziniae]MDM1784239.1 hypothetical protein [Acinetobacter bereziniae]